MNSDSSEKTPQRQSAAAVSSGADSDKISENSVAAVAERALVAAERTERGGPGRPKGARNKRSDALRQMQQDKYGLDVGELLTETLFDGYGEFIEQGGAPGEFMAWRAAVLRARTPGVKPKDALALVKAMADDLMPYVHQKLPTAIEVDMKGVMLAVVDAEGAFASHTRVGGLDLRPADVREPPALDASKNDEIDAQSDGESQTDEE